MVKVLTRVLANGNGITPISVQPAPVPEVHSMEPPGDQTQIGAIRAFISQRGSSAFSVPEIGHFLRKQGMQVSNIAVGRVLQRLTTKYGEIKIYKAGGGNVPNQYVRVEE
jgi:hypothetical protein